VTSGDSNLPLIRQTGLLAASSSVSARLATWLVTVLVTCGSFSSAVLLMTSMCGIERLSRRNGIRGIGGDSPLRPLGLPLLLVSNFLRNQATSTS